MTLLKLILHTPVFKKKYLPLWILVHEFYLFLNDMYNFEKIIAP